jgi:Amt family ammonium transporter
VKIGSFDWGLFGKTGFFLSGQSYDASAIVWFLFMMVFMDTAATIPTGTLAERWKMKSFVLFSFLIGAFIYPVFGCWVWGGGWLAQLGLGAGLGHGMVDFAGSGVVHLQGGALALILGAMIGPRLGKYDASGKPRTIPSHNIPMVVLGTIILAFGWFGFNAGSSLAGSDGRIGVIAVNTMLASASGALSVLLLTLTKNSKYDVPMACNGLLSGLVAITAPCAFVAPWAAFLIGGIAGVLVFFAAPMIERFGVDDPAGAIGVHGVNGIWGLLALGIFADGTYGAGWNGVGYASYQGNPGQGVTGLLYGDKSQFVAQVIGAGSCVLWNVVVGGALFWVVGKVVGGNRATAAEEMAGLDVAEMGVPAYDNTDGPELTLADDAFDRNRCGSRAGATLGHLTDATAN